MHKSNDAAFGLLAGLVICILILCILYNQSPTPVYDTHRIDSLKNEYRRIDSLMSIRDTQIDSLTLTLKELDKDSTRIVTRYETRIKYINRYTPTQLDSVLSARYNK